jgi:hypothetical protein
MDGSCDQRKSWSVNARVVLAFCIAPLGYPATVVAFSAFNGWEPSELAWVALVCAMISYVGTPLAGGPLYWFLSARRLTAFWIAPVAGFVVGAVLSAFVYSSVVFSLGLSLSSSNEGIGSIGRMARVIETSALSGIIVGILFWMIARPDRQPATRGS